MVNGWSIAAMFFTMIVPLGVFVYFLVRFLVHYKTGIKPMLIGAVIFLVFALLLEQLLHRFILQWNPVTASFFKNPLAYAVYGGLAAGIFEETGRLVGFRLFLKKQLDWKRGIAYGIGHGGLEVLYLGGMLAITQINNIALSFRINNGTFAALPNDVGLETARQQLIAAPPWAFFIGGFERIDAFIIQLGLSLLVMYAVARRRYLFYFLAVLAHALVDFTGPFLQSRSVALLPIEGIITVYAVVSLILILLSRRKLDDSAISV